jgi:hypothetical protein
MKAFKVERHGLTLSLPSLAPASAFGGQGFRDSVLMPEHWHLNTLKYGVQMNSGAEPWLTVWS